MATVASLQIKIGADVSAAINGLTKAQFAADQVKEAYIEANAATIEGGFVIAGWAQNFSTAISGVQRSLESIDLSGLDKDQQQTTKSMLDLAEGALFVTENITVAASAFSGMQAVAGPAIAGIARLIPSIGASMAALAGPIGIAVGALAAGAALIVSNWNLVEGSISNVEQIIGEANKAIVQEKLETEKLINTLKSDISTRQDKYNAITKLNEVSTTYFGKLTAEKSSVEEITRAYDGYIANILSAAKAQAATEKIVALSKTQLDIQLKYNKALLDAGEYQDLARKAPVITNGPNFGVEQAGADKALKIAQNLKKDLDKNQKEIDEISSFAANLNVEVDRGGEIKSSQIKTDRIQEIYNDAYKRIAGKFREFQDGFLTGSGFDTEKLNTFKSAYAGIAAIDPKSPKLDSLIKEITSLETLTPTITVGVAAKPDTSFTDIEDTLKSETFGKLNDIELKFKFSDDTDAAIKEKIQTIVEALQTAGSLNLDVNSDVVQELQAELTILRSRLKDPFEINIKVKTSKEQLEAELKKIANDISVVANQFQSALGVIDTLDSNSIAERNQSLDAYYEKQKALIESQVSDEGLKNKKLEALEKEVSAKRKAIKRDEAAANKRNAIFNAIINTARAVAEALPNVALSVLAGALGGAQVAAIAATPLPALQSGALVSGRNTVVVGEYAGADNNPELISPVNKVQKYITEAVQNSGGGGAQQLYSFISGDDIMLVSERGAYRKSRVG